MDDSKAANDADPNPAQQIPKSGRLAGIDFGTVRIGVALSDPDRILASPFENYDRKSVDQDARYFAELADSENVAGFIVGLPIHTDGKESQKSLEAREFGNWLQKTTQKPVDYFDERFTSAFANELLVTGGMTNKKKKKRLDMIAAQIMLTAYIESNKANSNLDLAD